jgi:glyoxylase I family protein
MFSFHHVTISRADIERTITFYGLLGFRKVISWSSTDKELQIVHMKLGSVLLEIFNYAKWTQAPDTTKSLETDLPRVGIKHFGLKVSNIDEARQNLIQLGHATSPEVKKGRTGITYFFINDPDGNWVEIVQDDREL